MKFLKHSLLPLALLATLGLGSCSDDDQASGQSKLEVRLTDAPGDFSQVVLDVQRVEIHVENNDDASGWQVLPLLTTQPLNVLQYANGQSALLVSADWPAGSISQIRLVLGTNNYVVTRDGQRFDLKTPSGQTSGVKLQINADLQKDVTYQLLLDFDVAKSIVERGNGKDRYLLKPVIRTVTQAVAGGIRGTVAPAAAKPLVMAIRNTAPIDTFSAATDGNGAFLLRGLPSGSYRVEFQTAAPYKNVTRDGVTVSNERITDLGSTSLN